MNPALPNVSFSSQYLSCGLAIGEGSMWNPVKSIIQNQDSSEAFKVLFLVKQSLNCQDSDKYEEAYEVSDVAFWSFILRQFVRLSHWKPWNGCHWYPEYIINNLRSKLVWIYSIHVKFHSAGVTCKSQTHTHTKKKKKKKNLISYHIKWIFQFTNESFEV